MKKLLVALLVSFLVQQSVAMGWGVEVTALRCEFKTEPMGIDVTSPRLGWITQSESRGWRQNAYQVLVASSKKNLKPGSADLWDSAKVASDRSNGIEYAGKPLRAHIQCFWKVRVWDKDGKVSSWSKPAFWTMGLPEPSDWQGAQWIGAEAPKNTTEREKELLGKLTLDGCCWIWCADGNPAQDAPAAARCFRRKFDIPGDRKIKQARAIIYADEKFVFFINGQQAGKSRPVVAEQWPVMHEIMDFTAGVNAGANVLAVAASDQSGPAGLAAKVIIDFDRGEPLVMVTDGQWKSCGTEKENWQQLAFDDSAWQPAEVLGKMGIEPWGELATDMQISGKLYLPPSPYLRKEFTTGKNIRRAIVYTTALGLYELRINGQKVGADFFTPGWTDYKKRIYYNSYDVTEMLRCNSGNAIGAILADGWCCGYVGFGKFVGFPKSRQFYCDRPFLRALLRIEYGDGRVETIVTDESWKVTTDGPVREADLLMGQSYDARMEMPGWDRAGFDDKSWAAVVSKDDVGAIIEAYPGVTVRKTQELKPVSLSEPQKGLYVFNLGQNFAGTVRLKVRGPAGTKVTLRYGEMCHNNGMIMTENLRQARATDTYILKGTGTEIWQGQFTFHGFQYVEVTGYPDRPAMDAVTGIVIHSNLPVAGSFECSDPMVNKLYRNITWTQRANYVDIPTDCPQRDERLGWTGDAVNFMRSATFTMDVAAFFTKWLTDLADGQRPDGVYPNFAPEPYPWGFGPDSPAWADAGIICPYFVYKAYDDRRIIEKNYDGMVRFMDYQLARSDNLIRPIVGHGDWLAIGEQTPNEVIATAFFAYDAQLMAEMAADVGRQADAQKYARLAEDIKGAFNKAFVSEDGKIKGDTQTAYALALNLNLLPQEMQETAVNHLVERIRQKDWHLATGFVGLRNLLPALSRHGRSDIAYRLLTNRTYPSWGYSIENGATTIWERWDSYTKEKGFQGPGMNSFCHYSLGSVCEWMFDTVGGISTVDSAYKQIIIRPMPDERLKFAKASYNSIHGQIAAAWRLDEDNFKLDVTIPANTGATVYVPAGDASDVTESGKPANKSKGVEFAGMDKDRAVFKAGSGKYHFVSRRSGLCEAE